jgi:HK97 family phage prohead protease
MMENLYTDVELKFANSREPTGLFEGYAAVFGNLDSHKDIIKPGAFKESLAERKAQGRNVPLHVMHRFAGGDGLPVGVLHKIEEDSKGLHTVGKISGMNTDAGRLLYERAKDGAFGGLSIGYKVKEGGAVFGGRGDAHRRILTNLDLKEISLVDSPSNAMSRISEFKTLTSPADIAKILHAGGVADRLAKRMAALAYKAVPGMEDLEDDEEDEHEQELKALLDQRARLRLAATLRKQIKDWK